MGRELMADKDLTFVFWSSVQDGGRGCIIGLEGLEQWASLEKTDTK